MRIFNNLPIRDKLMTSMGTILIVALILVVILNYIIVKNDIKNRIINHELPALINGIEKEVDFVIAQPLSVILSTTKNPFIFNWIKQGEPKEDLPYVSQYYASIRENANAFRSVIASDKSKTYYFVDGTEIESEPIIQGDPRHDWYFRFKESGKKYEHIIYDSGTNDWSNTLYINCRLEDNGEFIGDTGLGISLDKMVESIAAKKIGKYGNTFMVNPKGVINLHQDKKLINKKNIRNIPRLAPLADKILSTKKGNFIYHSKNGTIIAAVKYIPLVDWYLIVEVQESEMLADINRAFIKTVFLALGMFVIAILLVVLLSRKLTQPIKELVSTSKRLSKGDFTKKAQVITNDELGILAQSFNLMADQLKETFNVLETKNTELQHLDKIKDDFLANTSHELRTPLNGIIGIAESLRDGATGPLPNKTNANLSMIVSSGKRLANLVNDILDFSKLKHKNLDLQLKPIGLYEITNIVLTLSHPLIQGKPVQLVNAVSSHLPPVQADENRLQQILHNLIGNSIKFTERGEVKISAQQIDSHLEIVVSDTGIGIPTEQLESIFESFEQAEGSTAREYGGTGLGLAVTKQLVQLHGGKIWATSTKGQGSQFHLTLSIAKGEATQLSVETTRLSKIEAPQFEENVLTENAVMPLNKSEQLSILIVDDEPVNLQVLYNYLSLQNYRIVQATSGPEALAFMDDGLKPDAILLDVMMPKMTGYEVTIKLREKWKADELPILLLTAKNQITDLVVGLEAGANDYLTKPISKDELLARLKTHLNIKGLKAENVRLSTELDISHRLQKMLLPEEKELELIDGLDIAGFMESAEEVGGDYYDVLQHSGQVLFAIGDVTGHGLESGALAIMVQSAIRTLLANHETEPVKFFSALNQMVFHNVQRMNVDKNLTLALVNYQDKQLYLSGQHEEMIVVRQGELELIDTLDLGFPVGLSEDIAEFVHQIKIPLNAGDVVILYTDGITEALNLEKEEYRLERLCEVIQQNWQKTAQKIREAVIDDVRQFIGKQKMFDDITLLVLKQK
jgi:signal transduction histidine kinase/serine phosphatase RsbU (regulator of sigma subunit)